LVAAGVLELDAAEAVVDDYNSAVALRTEDWRNRRAVLSGRRRQVPSTPGPALPPRRVVACDQLIELTSGELHVGMVSLAADATTLSVVYREAAAFPAHRPSRSPSRRRGAAWYGPSGPPRVTLADDRGTTATASFSGGGSEHEWRGTLEADQPLATDARWIEVDGSRVELADRPSSFQVNVEELPAGDLALGYLWRQLAARRHFHAPPDVAIAIDALAAAGALAADDPELEAVRAVQEAHGRGGPPGSTGSAALPEPWRSLLAGARRARGPQGRVAIGAVTPEFDGVSVAVVSLESGEDGFAIDVETTGSGVWPGPFESSIQETGIAWWAADDRGGHYLGELGSWSGSDRGGHGTIEFWPVLDPKARRLDLMPTGRTTRAVITVPLPWAGERP